MATPIKNTPVVAGKDAKKFMDNLLSIIENAESGKINDKKQSELTKMASSYEVVSSLSNGAF
jgi:hypothetical protein